MCYIDVDACEILLARVSFTLSYLFSSILPCKAASGTGELGNNIDGEDLFSLEANEMKTGISPIPIMPSPIFLWRFKVFAIYLCTLY